MNRGCGIYMPISALPNKYGFGCFSKEAYDFIDYIGDLKIKYWQIEPLNILKNNYSTEYLSSYAGNPLYLDVEKYLSDEELEFFKLNNNLSYNEYKDRRNEALRYIFDKMYYSINIDKFIESNESWVYDYAVFMALKDELNCEYSEFLDIYKNIDSGETISFIKTHSEEIIYYIFLQYLFFKEWKELKKYANLRGIKIITTSDLLLGNDNADIYANKNLFDIEDNNYNFNFEKIKINKYRYFVNKYSFMTSFYDYVILNYNHNINENEFINIKNELEKNNIKNIIFDNNLYSDDILENESINININLKVLIKNVIFGFKFNNKDSLPNNYNKKIISYLGVKTYKPFYLFLSDEIIFEKIINYLNLPKETEKSIIIKMAIENLLSSDADVCIINIQDIISSDFDSDKNLIFDYKLKSNYKDESIFNYFKELIKNKNR